MNNPNQRPLLAHRLDQIRSRDVGGLQQELFVEQIGNNIKSDVKPHVAFKLLQAAERHGSPGVVFRPHLERSPWLRFNVSTRDDRRVLQWLQRQAKSKPA